MKQQTIIPNVAQQAFGFSGDSCVSAMRRKCPRPRLQNGSSSYHLRCATKVRQRLFALQRSSGRSPSTFFVPACLYLFQVDIVSFNMDAPQKIEKVIYPSGLPLLPQCFPLVTPTRSVIPNLNRKETEYASVLSASDSTK